nr:MAG TPA: hypothetical protein [Caudoviricetes sp.]
MKIKLFPYFLRSTPPYNICIFNVISKDQPALIHSQWQRVANHYWKIWAKKNRLSTLFWKTSNVC